MKKSIAIFFLLLFIVPAINAQTDADEFRKKAQREYEAFKKKAQQEYDSFRDKANKDYAEFVKQAWQEFNSFKGIEKLEEKPVPPVVCPKEDKDKQRKDEKKPFEDIIKIEEPIREQPSPIEPIIEEPILTPSVDTARFYFFGTEFRYTLQDLYAFNLQGTAEKDIAKGWQILSQKKYEHLIAECLDMRKERQLNDWAYLQMLEKFAENIIGKQCNESVLLMAYIYCQSGYMMRLAMDGNKLYMLYACNDIIYNKDYYNIGGQKYYLYGVKALESISICTASYPKERVMTLRINSEPLFAKHNSKVRDLQSKAYPMLKAGVEVNTNLIDFYDSYPTGAVNEDFGTRWAIYANTPLSTETKKTLYPALRKSLQGKTKQESAEMLLNFVQTSLVYEYDDKVWGGDRAFFAEETLYYPYADCEDRAILYSRLVRDLLGIKAVLIYYPGHLATAINLEGYNQRGDYIEVRGERYYIADPTYINAPIGLQMPQLKNEKIKVILLEQ